MFDSHIIAHLCFTTEHSEAAINAAEIRHLMANAELTNDHDLRASIITAALQL